MYAELRIISALSVNKSLLIFYVSIGGGKVCFSFIGCSSSTEIYGIHLSIVSGA